MATATTAKPSLSYFLNNPCHNCRRRRLRCDRSRPSCNKCSASGRECLGYDKLFVWTPCAGTGVGPKGTLGTSTPPAATTPSAVVATTGAGAGVGADASRGPAAGRCSSQVETRSATSSSASSSPGTLRGDAGGFSVVSFTGVETRGGHHAASARCLNVGHAEGPEREAEPTAAAMIRMQTTLTDPLFKDLDQVSRRYLSHFADRVCRDLAAHDGPDCNPFRELIPLSISHPFLLHIIIATSAVHMSNISHPKVTALPPSLMDPAAYLQHLRTTDGVSRQAFLDSLVAKERAIRELRAVLQNPEATDSGVLLAAVLFFVNFELIDLGREGWKKHLQGARRILNLLIPKPDSATTASRTVLHDCVISDFVIYHILGSTLVSAGLSASIAQHALELLPAMERVEAESYLCCPSKILHIILNASQLSGDAIGPEIPPSVTESALDLIRRALAFDIRTWAFKLQSWTKVPDLSSRTAVAMAHRAAGCLYILQAIPSTRSRSPVSVPKLVKEILSHLAGVEEGDPHFKATLWPTFIAGAEVKDEASREWVLARLMKMWGCCPWGYVFAAVEMLRRTWKMRDEGSVDEVGWLQEFWAMDMGFLIV